MRTFLISIEMITAIGVIVAVLLHTPKSEGMGAINASAHSFHSPKGMESGLDRITYALSTIFMVVGFILGVYF